MTVANKKGWTFDHLRKRELLKATVPILVKYIEPPQESDFTDNGSPLTAEQLKAFQKAERKYQADVKANTALFVLRAIPRQKYESLLDAHPATDQQLSEAKSKGDPKPFFDQERFAPALVHACLVEPDGLSLEEVTILLKEWQLGEAQALFNTALDVNTRNPGSSTFQNTFARMLG